MSLSSASLDSWQSLPFDNRFTRLLPADPSKEPGCRQVEKSCYSRVRPTPVAAPTLIAHSAEMASQLGIKDELVRSQDFAEIFGGNIVLPQMDPHAMCYGGHQFGNWAGQLGDGRAINLGDLVDVDGRRQTLQLKGAGPTPYSRFADGLAVLRSSVREFLCSEAMHHLGVPTTRALSLVGTGENVMRDMFYDGHPKNEPGAIVCRVAPSFLRFGSYQIFASRGDSENLRRLVDYTIEHEFPKWMPSEGRLDREHYAQWFHDICVRTAELMVHWMRVGFVHGVMNTDNMSVLGLTIDYGPYGWLEDYDPNWTPNTTDAEGRRYRFGNQPQIAQWNLAQFAGALLPLFDDETEMLQPGLRGYVDAFNQGWHDMMADKIGLQEFRPDTDDALFQDLLTVMQAVETDMTLFFRRLADLPTEPERDEILAKHFEPCFYREEELNAEYRQRLGDWVQQYRERLKQDGLDDASRRKTMNQVNPKYVLRNYLAQLAIDRSEQGDHDGVSELLEVLRRPYEEQPEFERYAEKRPEWARHRAGCSMLSCSS